MVLFYKPPSPKPCLGPFRVWGRGAAVGKEDTVRGEALAEMMDGEGVELQQGLLLASGPRNVSFGQIFACLFTTGDARAGLNAGQRERVEYYYWASVGEWAIQRWKRMLQSTLELNAYAVGVVLQGELGAPSADLEGDVFLASWWEDAIRQQAKSDADAALLRMNSPSMDDAIWWGYSFSMPPEVVDLVHSAAGGGVLPLARRIQDEQPAMPWADAA